MCIFRSAAKFSMRDAYCMPSMYCTLYISVISVCCPRPTIHGWLCDRGQSRNLQISSARASSSCYLWKSNHRAYLALEMYRGSSLPLNSSMAINGEVVRHGGVSVDQY